MSARQRMLLLVTLLFVLVMSSAFALVYSKHQSRKLFVEQQQSLHVIEELNAEWSRLQLEQSAWSEHSRIESKARKDLLMKRPAANEVVFVTVR